MEWPEEATGARAAPHVDVSPATGDAAFDSILRAAQADAPWAYEALYRSYAGRVLGYLRRQGAQEPEDVTSEAFIAAFRSIDRFSGDEADFRAWLFTIVHRRLLDERRRSRRRPRTTELVAEHDRAEHSDTAELAIGLGHTQVGQLLATLPEAQRDVLLLRVVAGLSAAETADILERRAGTVRMIHHRALAALREQLAHDV